MSHTMSDRKIDRLFFMDTIEYVNSEDSAIFPRILVMVDPTMMKWNVPWKPFYEHVDHSNAGNVQMSKPIFCKLLFRCIASE